jgi:hypothetical protein
MATYNKGILGQFNGKVGTVIGSSWKGISYIKSLPKKSGKEPTPAQSAHRLKFSLVSSFLKPIAPLLNLGYGSVKGNLTTYNAALSQHLTRAVLGNYPDFTIDYPQVIFSKGELPGPSGLSMSAAGGASLNFAWINNTSGMALDTDWAVILLFEPTQNTFFYVDQVVTRAEAAYTLTLPAQYVGKTVEIWMAFFAADGKMVSTSTYVGNAEVLT